MRIVVNDEAIDFTLQGEKALGEIVPALQEWLKRSDFTISALDVDGRSLDLESDEEWKTLELDGIDTLTVLAQSRTQQRLESLETAIELLALLRRVVEAGDSSRLSEVMTEYRYLREALPTLLSSRSSDGEQLTGYFDEILQRTGTADGAVPKAQDSRQEVMRGVDSLIALLETSARELLQPAEEYLRCPRSGGLPGLSRRGSRLTPDRRGKRSDATACRVYGPG